MMKNNLTHVYTVARYYTENGIHTLPVGKEKKPINSWSEFQNRLPTTDELEQWYQEEQNNIAIITGKQSGVIVVDVDVIKGGDPTPYKDCTCVARTVNGGYHFYYAWCEGVTGTVGVLPGVDLRSDGNYVVAPPSIAFNKDGELAEYTWETAAIPEVELKPFPKHLFPQISQKKQKLDFNIEIIEGGRNAALASFIGSLLPLVPQGEWDRLVLPSALGFNKIKCVPPQEDYEVQNTYKSLVQKELRKRQLLETQSTSLNIVSYEEIVEMPEIPTTYLIEDLIVEDTICMLSGESGIGKTWFYLELAVKLATGQLFLDKYKGQKYGTLIIDKENKMSMIKNRLAMLTREKDLNIHVTNNQEIILSDDWINMIIETCHRLNLRMVVFDSLRRVFVGNENNSDEVNEIYKKLHKLREAGITVLLIHHHNKGENKSPRGSSDLVNQLDIHLALEKNGTQLKLTIPKTRWFPPAPVSIRIDTDTTSYFKLTACGAENVQTVLKQEEIENKILSLLESGLKLDRSTIIKSILQDGSCSEGMIIRALTRLCNVEKLEFSEMHKLYRRK